MKDKQPITEKDPKEQWTFVRNVGHIVLSPIGLEILDKKYKPYALSYIAGFVMAEFTTLMLYTLYLYRDDLWRVSVVRMFKTETAVGFIPFFIFQAIQPVCIVGILVPVSHQNIVIELPITFNCTKKQLCLELQLLLIHFFEN